MENSSNNTAIVVKNVKKTFRISHEYRSTLREHFVNFFRRSEYETLTVLDHISLSVQEGEFLGVVGRNGSGKSTLLKLISGIYPATSGTMEVKGRLTSFLDLGVGFNSDLSARDNIFLYGAMLGIKRARLYERFLEIIRFAELERFVDTKMKYYSAGMYARLAFTLIIEVDAKIILIDEVLAVGDLAFQEKCFDKFRQFKEQGKTILFVSHDLDVMSKFCDRVAYISDGKIVCMGEVDKVLNQYIQDVTK
jgi:ABC-type polysaccharide/polyol phosphate transport system ATPase subunit